MNDIYPEIRPEFMWLAEKLDAEGLQYKVYNRGIQFNVTDADGVIQTYYPSTGTILFHASNEKSDRRTKVLRDKSIETFLAYVTERGRIQNLFKKEK